MYGLNDLIKAKMNQMEKAASVPKEKADSPLADYIRKRKKKKEQ